MTHEECQQFIDKENQQYNDFYLKIDKAIEPLVNFLKNQGFYPYASCSSHILTNQYKAINSPNAYVAFIYNEKTQNELNKLYNHKFPQSKFFEVIIEDFSNEDNKRAGIYIYFQTRYNRVYYLQKIYQSLNIKCDNFKLTRSDCYIEGKTLTQKIISELKNRKLIDQALNDINKQFNVFTNNYIDQHGVGALSKDDYSITFNKIYNEIRRKYNV